MAKAKEKKPESQGSSDRDELLKEILERWDDAYTKDDENRRQALEDIEFSIGNQWPSRIKQEREASGRPVLTINNLPQFIRQIAGDVRLNKPAIKVRGVGDGSDKDTADVFEGLIRNIEDQSRAPYVYALGADNAARCGIGWWRITSEYASDDTFEQDLRLEAVPNALAVVCDPQAVRPDRIDARYMFLYTDMAEEEFKKAYPKAKVVDFQSGNPDSQLATLQRSWRTDKKVRVAEYWCKKQVKKTLCKLSDGRTLYKEDYPETDPEGSKPTWDEALGEASIVKEREVVTVKVESYVVSGGDVLSGPHAWAGRYIPFVPCLGEEVYAGENVSRAGIVRDAKDSQRLLNYFRSQQAETVAMQPRAPWLVTMNMIGANKTLWDSANRSNPPYLVWTPDPEAPGAVPQRINPPSAATGLIAEADIATQDLHRTTGIYPASLGAKSNETSGVAIEARQQQSDTSTFLWKDNLNFAISTTGIMLIDLIQKLYDTERTVRVMADDGTYEMVTINKTMVNRQGQSIKYDLTAGKYDVTVDTGPSFSTRRKEASAGMIEFIRAFPAAAPVMGDLLAKNQDWPNSEELAKRLEALLPPNLHPPKVDPQTGEELPPPEPPPDPVIVKQQAEFELKRKQAEFDAEMSQKNFELERAKAAAQVELERDKFRAQMALQHEKQQAEHQGKVDAAVAEQVAQGVPQILPGIEAMIAMTAQMAQVSQAILIALSAPTQVIRDENGEIIGTQKVAQVAN